MLELIVMSTLNGVLFGMLLFLMASGLTVIFSMRISHRVYVMGHGRIVFEGTPSDLTSNAAVRKEWLEV